MTPLRPAVLAPPCLLALACLCQSAVAETSPWYVGVSQALSYDSNLYRVDDTERLKTLGFSPSDTVSMTSLVAGLDQPIGRQRVFGNATISTNRYRNNAYLDATSYRITGGLDWSTVERFSGTVSVAASEQQQTFNVDTPAGAPAQTAKNLERVNQFDAVARAGVVTRLTFEGSLGFRQLDYSAPEYARYVYEQTRGSIGLRYRPGIATFGASLSLSDTQYDVSTDRVRRTSLDFTTFWPANGMHSVYLRLSPTRVEYDQFSQSNFTSLTGALKWNWLPTGKLIVETQLVHDIGQESSFESFGGPVVVAASNTGRTTTELRVTVGYELTSKIALNTALSTMHRSLENSLVAANQAFVTGTGSDSTHVLSLGVRWTPLRSVQVGCNIGREMRSASGRFSQDYRDKNASCYGQFTLQ